MKRTITILAAALAIVLAAQAETLTFQLGGRDGAVILNNGKFNENGSFIGNTDGNTQILVGEVDFGSGNVYKAASIRFANGWGGGGKAIISVGDNLETATEVCRMGLINWNDSYTNFRSVAANISATPQGVKKVFLTFDGRAGNIMDVRLYNNQFTADQFESDNLLKEPNSWPGYENMATVLSVGNSVRVVPAPNPNNPEDGPHLDGDSWGWTGEGVVVKYGDLDFGNGDYKQVVLELASHWLGDQHNHSVDVYIDDYNDDANLIANVWCGIDVKARLYLARNIPAISGTHTVYLKWHGGSCNIANVHFVKDYLYSQGNTYFPFVNPEDPGEQEPVISDNAANYSFRADTQGSSSYVGRNSGRTRILNKGQWEDNNVGWTGTGTVLRISNVNFGSGDFNQLIARYSTATWDASLETNFKFYIDTEINKINFTSIVSELTGYPSSLVSLLTGGRSLDALLDDNQVIDLINGLSEEQRNTILAQQMANLTPIATVKMKPTNNWNVLATTAGDMSRVTGTHTVYILYTANGDNGANLKDFWLNTKSETPAPPVYVSSTLAQIKQSGADGTDYQIVDGNLTCVNTYKDGDDIMLVCKDDNAAAQQLPQADMIDYMGWSSFFNCPAANYNHSNWIVLRSSEQAARLLKGYKLKNVKGVLANSRNELQLSEVPYLVALDELYHPNTYLPVNFAGTQYSVADDLTYFFVTPSADEYVFVTWTIWDGQKFVSKENSSGLYGSFAGDFGMVGGSAGMTSGSGYELKGVVTAGTSAAGAPRRAPGDTDFVVKVLSITENNQIVTGITDLNVKPESATHDVDVTYDLTGRRVVNPTPGIYIVGGKKVVVK